MIDMKQAAVKRLIESFVLSGMARSEVGHLLVSAGLDQVEAGALHPGHAVEAFGRVAEAMAQRTERIRIDFEASQRKRKTR